jgi:folate-binding protein YgfZ
MTQADWNKAMQAAFLPDRGVVKVSGDDAKTFLNGLLTVDVGKMQPGAARYGALLAPQGKIVSDFIVYEALETDGGGFLIDCPLALAGTLVDKFKFYKLRAKVAADDLSATLGILAVWDGTPPDSEFGPGYADPRLPALGHRIILPRNAAADAATELGADIADAEAYDAHRIALGVPRGGADFAYGDTFPHEADMDQLGGVDFDKGCYVGQEVVSRIEHRANARTRVLPIAYDEFAPASGLDVVAGEKPLGTLGSTANGLGLALLRIDRVADALAAGTPITAGGIAIHPKKPAWARFDLPGVPS